MINLLASSILLILFFHPALLIVRRLNVEPKWDRLVTWFLLSSTLIPLFIFYLNHFIKVPLNQKNLLLSLLLLNFILFLFFKFFPSKIKAKPPKSISIKDKYIYLVTVLIAVLYFNFPYIFRAQPILGGDTPHYLSHITLLIKNQFPGLVFDRSIVYFFPAILSLITNISVEIILKFYIASYELSFILISLSLARKYISSHFLLFFSIALIFSPATYIMSKFVIAFFISLTVLYYLISQISSASKNIYKNLLFPILWGLLFNLHGIVAFSSLAIISPILIFQSIKHKIHPKKYFLWIILFILTSQPLISSQWGRVNAGVIQPIIASLNLDKINNQPNENKQDLSKSVKSRDQAWTDQFTSHKSKSLKEFPLYADSFTSSFLVPTLIFSILGIILSLSNPKVRKNILPILITSFIFFLLTQQEFFGMEWFPIRFVFAMGPLIYLLAFLYLDKLSVRLKKPLMTSLICLFVITLPIVFVGAKKISTLSANIKITEYNYIKGLKPFISQGDAIFVAAVNDRWIQTLIPQSTVYKSHFGAICGDESVRMRVLKQIWDVSKAFSNLVTLDESIQTFNQYSQEKPYFVYLDTINYHCINGELFPASDYTILDQQGGYIFLKHD
jgi:hypothetical protein